MYIFKINDFYEGLFTVTKIIMKDKKKEVKNMKEKMEICIVNYIKEG